MDLTSVSGISFPKPGKKIGIVIPWFGPDLRGGAEMHAYNIAKNLVLSGVDVEVLSTCSKSFLDDWTENFYEPGDYVYDDCGIKVKRFAVEERDPGLFNLINLYLLDHKTNLLPTGSPLDQKAEADFFANSIQSSALIQHLRECKSDYSYIIALPYLYGVVVSAMKELGPQGILLPCLHDEPYAYLSTIRNMLSDAGGLMFNSRGELQLALKMYGDSLLPKSYLTGGGVEIATSSASTTSSPSMPQAEDGTPLDLRSKEFFLYLGRRSPEKNIPYLIDAFAAVRDQLPEEFKLVLAGVGECPSAWREKLGDRFVDAGLVNEETKQYLLQNCRVLINPSLNESYSRILFEAWFEDVPIMVHQDCLCTMGALEDSDHAGFCFDAHNLSEHLIAAAKLPLEELNRLGIKGHKAALKLASWQGAVNRINGAIASIEASSNTLTSPDEAPQPRHWFDLWFSEKGECPARLEKFQLLIDPEFDGQGEHKMANNKLKTLVCNLKQPYFERAKFVDIADFPDGANLETWDQVASALVMCEKVLLARSSTSLVEWYRLATHLDQEVSELG